MIFEHVRNLSSRPELAYIMNYLQLKQNRQGKFYFGAALNSLFVNASIFVHVVHTFGCNPVFYLSSTPPFPYFVPEKLECFSLSYF